MAPKNANKREQEEEQWKLTRDQVTARVREIRSYLTNAADSLSGTYFDIMTDDEPQSISCNDFPWPFELSERLNPSLIGYCNRVNDRLPDEDARDDFNNLRVDMAQAAFAIGVLAGAVFHGASEREIDRLERGLIHATCSRHWQVKS
jgi:hypothetical protein